MGEGESKEKFFVWRDAGRPYAVPLDVVVSGVRMVDITPVPDPPPGLLGLINVRGEVTPVVSVAAHFGFSSTPRFEDHLLLVRSGQRLIALLSEELIGLLHDEVAPIAEVLPESRHVLGVLRHGGALVLVPDLGFLLRELEPAIA